MTSRIRYRSRALGFLRGILTGLVVVSAGLPTLSCSIHEPRDFEGEPTAVAAQWRHLDQEGADRLESWWKSFEDPNLDRLVQDTFEHNFELEQAWARLDRLKAEYGLSRAPLFPTLDLNTGANLSRFRNDDVGGGGSGGFQPAPIDLRTAGYRIGPQVRWEIDLWNRIESGRQAAAFALEAGVDDVQATALLLSGQVAEAWFEHLTQESQDALLQEQIDTSEELLELTELRFSSGQGTALDVLQQRLQLAAVKAQRPELLRARDLTSNRLAILTGRAPADFEQLPDKKLPAALPAFPRLGSPSELISRRPDLRAAHARLKAADREVAVAIADKLPRLDLTLSYEFSAARGSGLFDQQIGQVLASIFTPLFDGGRRDAEVERRRARVRELTGAYAQSYLIALREIEDALVQEKRGLETLGHIDGQLTIARQNLLEARLRYANGLAEFLTVLTGVQSLQNLQRQRLTTLRGLLFSRGALYRALGSRDLEGLFARPDPAQESEETDA